MPSPPRQTPSTLATWSATIVRALDGLGLDGAAIASQAGIAPEVLADPEGRVPRDALTRLWKLAVAESGNPAFGLLASRHTLQTTFHALGYAVLASATLREALSRVIRHQRLFGDILRLSLEQDGSEARFTMDVSSGPGLVPWEAMDAFVAVNARQARMLMGRPDFRPLAVSLQRPVPQDPSPWEEMLRAPVRFAQPATFLAYPVADLDRPLPAANAELARRNDEVAARYLERLSGNAVLARARAALLESLPSGAPTKPELARRLATSPRSLQRLLAAEGTSFSDLLAEARLTLAKNYLDEGRLPVTEIAFVLGFADTSAFSRAFRRWTGVAPSDWARSHRTR
jgi:AraC-like DNA-binding protein